MKEFLSERNVPFTEYDVSRDQAAARDMVQASHQNGVPVTLITINSNNHPFWYEISTTARKTVADAIAFFNKTLKKPAPNTARTSK